MSPRGDSLAANPSRRPQRPSEWKISSTRTAPLSGPPVPRAITHSFISTPSIPLSPPIPLSFYPSILHPSPHSIYLPRPHRSFSLQLSICPSQLLDGLSSKPALSIFRPGRYRGQVGSGRPLLSLYFSLYLQISLSRSFALSIALAVPKWLILYLALR